MTEIVGGGCLIIWVFTEQSAGHFFGSTPITLLHRQTEGEEEDWRIVKTEKRKGVVILKNVGRIEWNKINDKTKNKN